MNKILQGREIAYCKISLYPKISFIASFKATVIINAPEELISKEDKAYFESLGPKIGQPEDTFEIAVSELRQDIYNEGMKVYTCTQDYKTFKDGEFISRKSSIDIPYIKSGKAMEEKSPLAYLKRIFSRKIG